MSTDVRHNDVIKESIELFKVGSRGRTVKAMVASLLLVAAGDGVRKVAQGRTLKKVVVFGTIDIWL